jgi:hypothetical protein
MIMRKLLLFFIPFTANPDLKAYELYCIALVSPHDLHHSRHFDNLYPDLKDLLVYLGYLFFELLYAYFAC